MMCLQKGTPVDDFPFPGGWESDVDKEYFGPENQLTHLMCKVPNLKYRLHTILDLKPDSMLQGSINDLLIEAKAIDAEVYALSSYMLPICGHRTVGVCNSITEDLANAFFWLGPIEMYNDLFAATFINFCRVSRISCQIIIMSCYTWLGQNLNDTMALERRLKSVAMIQRLTDEICASIPFHFCPDFFLNGGALSEFSTSKFYLINMLHLFAAVARLENIDLVLTRTTQLLNLAHLGRFSCSGHYFSALIGSICLLIKTNGCLDGSDLFVVYGD